jgi:hypothetical protein
VLCFFVCVCVCVLFVVYVEGYSEAVDSSCF